MNFSRDVLIAKLGRLQDVIERIQSKRPATLEGASRGQRDPPPYPDTRRPVREMRHARASC